MTTSATAARYVVLAAALWVVPLATGCDFGSSSGSEEDDYDGGNVSANNVSCDCDEMTFATVSNAAVWTDGELGYRTVGYMYGGRHEYTLTRRNCTGDDGNMGGGYGSSSFVVDGETLVTIDCAAGTFDVSY